MRKPANSSYSINDEEQQRLVALARRLQRSPEDTLNWLLRQYRPTQKPRLVHSAFQLPLPLDYDSDGRKWG